MARSRGNDAWRRTAQNGRAQGCYAGQCGGEAAGAAPGGSHSSEARVLPRFPMVIGRDYFTRQAEILLNFAKATAFRG